MRADAAGPLSPRSRKADDPLSRPISPWLIRICFAAVALLLAVFLVFSWKLAQQNLDQDREEWIETLLRR
jgi:type VI protein secretion system component VasF